MATQQKAFVGTASSLAKLKKKKVPKIKKYIRKKGRTNLRAWCRTSRSSWRSWGTLSVSGSTSSEPRWRPPPPAPSPRSCWPPRSQAAGLHPQQPSNATICLLFTLFQASAAPSYPPKLQETPVLVKKRFVFKILEAWRYQVRGVSPNNSLPLHRKQRELSAFQEVPSS